MKKQNKNMLQNIDYSQVNKHILSNVEAFLNDILPGGRFVGSEYEAINPTRADNNPGSFKVNAKSGVWSDFATGDSGGDLISLYAYLHGLSQYKAAKALSEEYNLDFPKDTSVNSSHSPKKWTPITPVPADAPKMPIRHYKHGKYSARYPYYNEVGQIIGYTVRFKLASGGKLVIPLTYCKNGDGQKQWQWQSFEKPRPMYGLERLSAKPGIQAFVFEGEKCADKAQKVLPGIPCVSWIGGSNGVKYIDFSPLIGRKAVLWPDADKTGFEAMLDVYKKIKSIAKGVRIVEISDDKPKKWDVADAVDEGWSGERIINFIKDNLIDPAKNSTFINQSNVVSEEPWPEPIPLNDYFSLPKFPTEVLPSPFREIVESITEVCQVDFGLPGSFVLSILSTSLMKKAFVNLGTHQEPLNLYLVSIAEPGERKSIVVSILAEPIYKYQKKKQEEIKEKTYEAITKQEIIKDKITLLKKQAARKNEDYEIEKISREILKLKNEIEENPIPVIPTYVADDITTEMLAVILSDNNESGAILSAEGGIFAIVAGLYNERGYNLDLYLKSHSGDSCSIHRISRDSITMESPALTIGLTVQSEVINEIGSNKRFRGRGLLARFLYSFNPSNVGYRIRQKKEIQENLLMEYKKHIIELMNLPKSEDYLKLSDEAQIKWDEFYNDVESMLKPEGRLSNIKDWGSKLPGAVARIAGLLHFAINGSNAIDILISEETIVAAATLGGYYLEHALAAFGLMGESPGLHSARRILEYINEHQPESFKGRDVLRHKSALESMNDVLPGLEVLIERGYIRERENPLSSRIGRPEAKSYEVNPKIYYSENH